MTQLEKRNAADLKVSRARDLLEAAVEEFKACGDDAAAFLTGETVCRVEALREQIRRDRARAEARRVAAGMDRAAGSGGAS